MEGISRKTSETFYFSHYNAGMGFFLNLLNEETKEEEDETKER